MIPTKELKKYCESKLLDFELSEDGILMLDNKEYCIVDDQETLFDSDFTFLPSSEFDVDGYVYKFGGRWYLQDIEEKEGQLKELLNIGKAKQKLPIINFLGIHSGNEMLNGVGTYKKWLKKAKFLGVKALGICENKSLSGVIAFQTICKDNDIKPIIGMVIPIESDLGKYRIKAYAKNFEGWQSLLKFNEILNVEGKTHVSEEILKENAESIHIIIDPKETQFNIKPDFIKYYQLDTVIFEEEEKDIDYINNLEAYLKSSMEPIAIYDAYCPEQDEWDVREKLWGISKVFDYRTKNQYFKNTDQYALEFISMFEETDKSWVKIFKKSMVNLQGLVDSCNFEYDLTNRHLPKYFMTEEECEKFSTNEDFFMHLIKKGFKERGITGGQKYIDRLKKEIKILKDGDVIDYFLITYKIIKAAKENDTLVGIGRGSAGGSLVSYLLGIIQIDPLEFDLLFERFLNPGRMGEWKECKAYEIETNEGKIRLNEKSLVRVMRNQKEMPIFVEDLKEGDEIIRY